MKSALHHSTDRVLGIFGLMCLLAALGHGCVAHAATTNLCWQAEPALFEVERTRSNTVKIIGRTTNLCMKVNFERGDSFRVRSISKWSEPIKIQKP